MSVLFPPLSKSFPLDRQISKEKKYEGENDFERQHLSIIR